MDNPKIYTYSLVSVISEKFEAIVSLGYANSRFKDFYDIYVLMINFNFEGRELHEAIKKTFIHRETRFEDIIAFEKNYGEDLVRKNRWNAFIKKKRAMIVIEFEDVLMSIKNLLLPVIDAITNNEKFEKRWVAEKGKWE